MIYLVYDLSLLIAYRQKNADGNSRVATIPFSHVCTKSGHEKTQNNAGTNIRTTRRGFLRTLLFV